jgi:hypothetical protein
MCKEKETKEKELKWNERISSHKNIVSPGVQDNDNNFQHKNHRSIEPNDITIISFGF